MDLRGAFAVLLAFVASSAFGQNPAAKNLEAQGGRLLAKTAVEKLFSGARTLFADADGVTRSWIQNGRGDLMATLQRANAARPINGRGSANVDQNGAYCVRIEWPRAEESWCRRIFQLNGVYYAVSDDAGQTVAVPLQIVQPDPGRLTSLARLWSLVRIPPGAIAR